MEQFTIKDFTTTDLITFTPDMNVISAMNTLINKNISGAPVVDKEGNLVGMLSEKDCMKTVIYSSYYREMGNLVSDIMSKHIITVDAAASIISIAELFLNSSFRRFPVLENGKLIGQVSRRDILRAILETR